ncbi:hypothetical protein D5018_11365 [Parashewanella curva]|uniref:Uncharacterized protein n=1 Tax=Parashewanella curva TaxID=2338552 RepID=A0A3L8PW32_9GAMM|nr:hypothetical protein D5018_11365 [Parashewanella curva]
MKTSPSLFFMVIFCCSSCALAEEYKPEQNYQAGDVVSFHGQSYKASIETFIPLALFRHNLILGKNMNR